MRQGICSILSISQVKKKRERTCLPTVSWPVPLPGRIPCSLRGTPTFCSATSRHFRSHRREAVAKKWLPRRSWWRPVHRTSECHCQSRLPSGSRISVSMYPLRGRLPLACRAIDPALSALRHGCFCLTLQGPMETERLAGQVESPRSHEREKEGPMPDRGRSPKQRPYNAYIDNANSQRPREFRGSRFFHQHRRVTRYQYGSYRYRQSQFDTG